MGGNYCQRFGRQCDRNADFFKRILNTGKVAGIADYVVTYTKQRDLFEQECQKILNTIYDYYPGARSLVGQSSGVIDLVDTEFLLSHLFQYLTYAISCEYLSNFSEEEKKRAAFELDKAYPGSFTSDKLLLLTLMALRKTIDLRSCHRILDISRVSSAHRGYDNHIGLCKSIYFFYYRYFAEAHEPTMSLEKHGLMAILISIAAVRLAINSYLKRVIKKYGSKSDIIEDLDVKPPEIVYIEDTEGVKLYSV